MNHSYSKTEKRRALQPLWNALAQGLLQFQDRGLVLAVSGGGDSLALMESYARWPQAVIENIWVASLDHGQRKEGRIETDRVLKRAQVLGFKVFTDAYCGTQAKNEAALRTWRYSILMRFAEDEGLSGIVTAHHLSDDAEGYAMNLLGVGGGQQGRSMKAQQNQGTVVLLRPFLQLSRETLGLALSAIGLSHHAFQDPGDAKDHNWRAFVRHEILPQLKRVQPRISERLSQKAKDQDDVLDSFEGLFEQYMQPSPEGGFLVNLQIPTEFLLKMVCVSALKQVSPQTDMRAGEKTLAALCQKAFSNTLKKSKVFKFSGAQIEVLEGFLWIHSLN